jgi:hypothetical protein
MESTRRAGGQMDRKLRANSWPRQEEEVSQALATCYGIQLDINGNSSSSSSSSNSSYQTTKEWLGSREVQEFQATQAKISLLASSSAIENGMHTAVDCSKGRELTLAQALLQTLLVSVWCSLKLRVRSGNSPRVMIYPEG